MGKNRKRNYDDTTIKTPSDIKLSNPIDNRLIEKEKASSFVILFSDYWALLHMTVNFYLQGRIEEFRVYLWLLDKENSTDFSLQNELKENSTDFLKNPIDDNNEGKQLLKGRKMNCKSDNIIRMAFL